MWNLVPWPGIEPRPPVLGARTTREVPKMYIFNGWQKVYLLQNNRIPNSLFFVLKIPLFLFGCAGSSLLCSVAASWRYFLLWCSRFSLGWLLLLRSVALGCMGFSSSVPGLWSTGSIVGAHGLGCSTVSGIFLDQGWHPCPLCWQVDS